MSQIFEGSTDNCKCEYSNSIIVFIYAKMHYYTQYTAECYLLQVLYIACYINRTFGNTALLYVHTNMYCACTANITLYIYIYIYIYE